jgi:Zn-dependent metalloprotease
MPNPRVPQPGNGAWSESALAQAPFATAIRRSSLVALVIVALLAPLLPAQAAQAAAPGADRDWGADRIRDARLRDRDRGLARTLPGTARLGYHPETGRVRFISGTPGKPLSGTVAAAASGRRALSSADARGAARRFVDRYGGMFGLKAPGRELRVAGTRRSLAPRGRGGTAAAAPVAAGMPNATVRFEQVRDGVAVMGGELVVQLSEDGAVISAAGEVLPSGAKATTAPRVSAAAARAIAATWLARREGRALPAVRTSSDGLALYDPRIMDDPSLASVGRRLVWRIDARVAPQASRRGAHRLVLVDARSAAVLTSIARNPSADRRICDNRNQRGRSASCQAPFTRVEGQQASGIGDVDAAYRLMGVTAAFFKDRFGRDGIDGKGSRYKATVRYCGSRCPWNNAEWTWSRQQAAFGRGWAGADDIVAHEFVHGILDHEAPLFYHYQSGAINESFADVFGELVDLSYPKGNDRPRVKWRIGEDTPIGAFRDMKHPPRFGHPDRVRSPKWHTGPGDDGGVHRNNGVGNKAAYLMADGGSFRGTRVRGIGRNRTARVWYQALTTRLTSAANYIDLYDALNAACTDLAGSGGMTLAHCKSVRQATTVTQMNQKPRTNAPRTAPVCAVGKAPIDVFRDDLEDPGADRWESDRLVGKKRGWFYPQNPNNVAGWDGSWSSSGKLNFYAPNRGSRSDSVMRMRAPVELPPKAYLRFEHGFDFDKDARRRYDGGLVEIKVDGGPWRGVGQLFTHGGYDGRIAKGTGNPLKGRKAFTGSSRGWAQARVDLRAFAGSKVKVRFRMGSDRKVGARGWYIDDIRIYTCSADDEPPTGSLTIDAGADRTREPDATLALTWADADTWVTRLRLSNSKKMNGPGIVLAKGINMPIRDTVRWDLSDTTWGGSGKPGTRRVYAQVRDAAGNWSDVFSDAIEWRP